MPAALAAMSALTTLLLDGNRLVGLLPAALRAQSGRLQTVALFGNALQARRNALRVSLSRNQSKNQSIN